MASPTRWTRVWVNSGSWWWTGRPGVLRFMGWKGVGHDWATELNWTEAAFQSTEGHPYSQNVKDRSRLGNTFSGDFSKIYLYGSLSLPQITLLPVECSKNISINLCADSHVILYPRAQGHFLIMKCMCSTETYTHGSVLWRNTKV